MTACFGTSLLNAVQKLARPGRLHIAAWERGQPDDGLLMRADDVVAAASTIKVPIFAAVLDAVAAGRFDLDQPVPIPPTRVGGSGILHSMPRLEVLTLADLATLMMIVSDNTATNVLIDLVGIRQVNRFCEEVGLAGTRVRRLMMDTESARRGFDNTTTARDQARLFELFADGTLLSTDLREYAVTVLANQQFDDGLRSLIPEDISVSHKTGDLPGLRHDAGIITASNGRQAVVAVLVSGIGAVPTDPPGEPCPSVLDALGAIASVGHAVWRFLEEQGGEYALGSDCRIVDRGDSPSIRITRPSSDS